MIKRHKKMLEINKNYAIGSDELNIILYKQGGKLGKKYWKILGYFSTCETALKAVVDMLHRCTVSIMTFWLALTQVELAAKEHIGQKQGYLRKQHY
jgi:hypothetical protein